MTYQPTPKGGNHRPPHPPARPTVLPSGRSPIVPRRTIWQIDITAGALLAGAWEDTDDDDC
jgi:hypothetical protein